MVSDATLDQRATVAALLQGRRDMLVIAGLGSPAYDLHAAGDDDGNFYLWGAMGGADGYEPCPGTARPHRAGADRRRREP